MPLPRCAFSTAVRHAQPVFAERQPLSRRFQSGISAERCGTDWGWIRPARHSVRARQRIDDEVKRIITKAHDEAVRLLTENRSRLDALAETLVREETLDQPQAYAAAGLTPPAAPAAPEATRALVSAT
jgi:Peptidase family M41